MQLPAQAQVSHSAEEYQSGRACQPQRKRPDGQISPALRLRRHIPDASLLRPRFCTVFRCPQILRDGLLDQNHAGLVHQPGRQTALRTKGADKPKQHQQPQITAECVRHPAPQQAGEQSRNSGKSRPGQGEGEQGSQPLIHPRPPVPEAPSAPSSPPGTADVPAPVWPPVPRRSPDRPGQ